MKADLQLVCPPKRQIVRCPWCHYAGVKGHYVGHLLERMTRSTTFGPWYCDECGYGIRGTVNLDGTVDIEKHSERLLKTWVLLRYSGDDNRFYIVVEGMMWVKADADTGDIVAALVDRQSNDDYYYGEHTCPWNYLRLTTSFNGNPDYHGLFEHVETILRPSQEKMREYFDVTYYGHSSNVPPVIEAHELFQKAENFKHFFQRYEEEPTA